MCRGVCSLLLMQASTFSRRAGALLVGITSLSTFRSIRNATSLRASSRNWSIFSVLKKLFRAVKKTVYLNFM